MSTYESDEAAILKAHTDWWEANHGLDIPLMQTAFPVGDEAYLMFNLSGHPYFGLDEKTTLWEYYNKCLEVGRCDVRIMRLDISGDMAYLACEAYFPSYYTQNPTDGTIVPTYVGADGPGAPIRATEVYKRDDGAGAPQWTMWHFHCSPLPPADEPRPAFNDTYASRGLGYTPWGDSPEGVGQ
jgi:hypothetical protein